MQPTGDNAEDSSGGRGGGFVGVEGEAGGARWDASREPSGDNARSTTCPAATHAQRGSACS